MSALSSVVPSSTESTRTRPANSLINAAQQIYAGENTITSPVQSPTIHLYPSRTNSSTDELNRSYSRTTLKQSPNSTNDKKLTQGDSETKTNDFTNTNEPRIKQVTSPKSLDSNQFLYGSHSTEYMKAAHAAQLAELEKVYDVKLERDIQNRTLSPKRTNYESKSSLWANELKEMRETHASELKMKEDKIAKLQWKLKNLKDSTIEQQKVWDREVAHLQQQLSTYNGCSTLSNPDGSPILSSNVYSKEVQADIRPEVVERGSDPHISAITEDEFQLEKLKHAEELQKHTSLMEEKHEEVKKQLEEQHVKATDEYKKNQADLEMKREEALKQLNALQNTYQELSNQLESTKKSQNDIGSQEINKLQESLDKTKQSQEELKQKHEKLAQEHEKLSKNHADLLSKHEHAVKEHENTISDHEEKLNTDTKNLKDRHEQALLEKQREQEKLQLEAEGLRVQLQSVQQKHDDLHAIHTELNQTLKHSKEELLRYQQELEETQKEKVNLQKKNDEIQSELAISRQKEEERRKKEESRFCRRNCKCCPNSCQECVFCVIM